MKFTTYCFTALPQESSNGPVYSITGSVDGSQVNLTINITDSQSHSIGSIAATGKLASDGKSMSGTYTETGNTTDAGNWTASLAGSVSGTYSGSLTSSANPSFPLPVTATITEATDGSVTGNASVSNSSCVSSLTFQNGGPESNYAVGGAFQVAQPNPLAYADVVPNGDGTFSVSYSIQTPTCTDAGTGTLTKH